MSDFAVLTSSLTKRYGRAVLAVDRVDLRVARGEIYAFLGLNGAGKSTTIRMLLGMIRPTTGHAELFGERVHAGATDLWRRVGHLVDSAIAYPELTVRENLDVARRLAGVDGCARRRPDDRAARARARMPIGVPAPCRSATCSGWRSRGRCSMSPSCWCSTSRRTASIRPASSRSAS